MPTVSSVLIIDDDAALRQTLVDIFKKYKVSTIGEAANAEQGFQRLKEEPYSLIICDYQLPGLNGIAFVGKLRISGDQTPVLLITGVPDKTVVIAAAQQMKVDFLAKPFTVTALLAVVEKLIAV
jgi:DNA-binding NtrC family response regulator